MVSERKGFPTFPRLKKKGNAFRVIPKGHVFLFLCVSRVLLCFIGDEFEKEGAC